MYEIKYRSEDEFTNTNDIIFNRIPNDWKIIKNGILFYLGRGRVISKEEIEDNQGIYPVYSSQTANDGKLGEISSYDFDGDFITWTTDGANAGTVFRRTGRFNCTNVCGTLKSKKEVDLSYATYMLSTITKRFVRIDINPKLMNNEMNNIRILYPSLIEQQKIANFLDIKTAQFDSIISKKEELVKKLEEAKKSLISEVVTGKVKIVDEELVQRKPEEMKDSGVEWLGMIPREWDKFRLKDIADNEKHSFVDGPFGSDLKNEEYVNEGIPLIQLNNIKDGNHVFNKINFITEKKFKALKKHSAYPGEIVFAKMAEPVARCCKVSDRFNKYIIVADCVKLKPKINFNVELLVNFINSDYIRFQAESLSKGTTRIRINLGSLKELLIYLPKKSEEKLILRFINQNTTRIESLLAKIKNQIQKLNQAKQSLISEAVTGKIDLRDWEITEEGEIQ